jgi:hypothetical protein
MLGKIVLCESLIPQFNVITFFAVGLKRGKCFWSFLGPISVVDTVTFGPFWSPNALLVDGPTCIAR